MTQRTNLPAEATGLPRRERPWRSAPDVPLGRSGVLTQARREHTLTW
jgi:hypothetical protein